MSRVRIVHRTGYSYAGTVVASYNEARMTPLTTPWQTTLDARIEVEPSASTFRYCDYWGTQVTAFEVRVPHDRLTVTARSLVESALPDPVDAAAVDAVSWAELRSTACMDRFAELLSPTDRSDPGEEALSSAREIVGDRPPAHAGQAVAEWLADTMEYVKGATGVHTSAAQAWEVRQGVCQDFAHLAVGVLRGLGVPARYVSGYLQTSSPEIGVPSSGESHAWIEWWAGGWQAWDPTNGRAAGVDHIVVARGRDYNDVAPLQGIYAGPGGGDLFVVVEFTRVA